MGEASRLRKVSVVVTLSGEQHCIPEKPFELTKLLLAAVRSSRGAWGPAIAAAWPGPGPTGRVSVSVAWTMGSTLTANIDINDQGKAVVASLWIDGAEPIINVGCPEGQGLQVSITVGVLSVVSYSQLDVFNALPVDIQSDIIQSLLGRPPLGDSTDERWQCECMGCQIARQLNASKTNEYVEHN